MNIWYTKPEFLLPDPPASVFVKSTASPQKFMTPVNRFGSQNVERVREQPALPAVRDRERWQGSQVACTVGTVRNLSIQMTSPLMAFMTSVMMSWRHHDVISEIK